MATFSRCPHRKHPTDNRDADQTVGPRHFEQGHGAGGRQHAHPHPRLQHQNRNRNPPARTPTASRFRQFGQVVEVGTLGFERGTRPKGQRRRMARPFRCQPRPSITVPG